MDEKYTYKLLGLNVASSKNSKQIAYVWCYGKRVPRLINSLLALDYYDFVLPKLEEMKVLLVNDLLTAPKPYRFHFHFVRKDRRHFDYINVCQIIADALQKAEILPDDDMDHFVPIFDGYEVDRNNPGVVFYVEK